jgi:hypothetical protein
MFKLSSISKSEVNHLTPWQDAPYSLISWRVMIEFSARRFLWCGSELQSIKHHCLLGSYIGSGEDYIYDLSRGIDERAHDKALESLGLIEVEFRNLGMKITADMVKEITDELTGESRKRSFQWLTDQIVNIEKLVNKELEKDTFFFVPSERAKYFPLVDNLHIFGESVSSAFPGASNDIAESGICLALARGTAAVFHLMRVLEIGLSAIGNKFGVSLEHTNWAPAIDQIEKKIRNMNQDLNWKALPDCKEQQEFYSQVISHFGVLKDAWRNHTMHARGFYTEEQAALIFENTKAFMNKLASRLSG